MALYHPEYELAVTEGPVLVSVGGKQPDDDSLRSGCVVQKQVNISGDYVL